ncbi:MAG: response regulator [Nitrospirae bacterium]|nr:response regulator [Nitrospirota bacterium]
MATRYTHKILCVDDNDNNLFSLEVLLSELECCHIHKTKTGKAALEILINEEIDIILLDVQMPEMDGFELAELIRSNKRTKDIPIIFLTAVFRSDDFIKKGYRSGAVDYLTKPIDDNQFLNKINLYLKLFDKEKMLRELNESLNQRVEEQLAKNRQQDYILMQQARLASMGEMIVQIAHHWRQPINTIGLLIQDLLDAYDFKELTREYIDDNVNRCMEIIEKMSDTIDEFRGYYRKDSGKSVFMLKSAIDKAVSFIKPILSAHHIDIEVNAVDARLTGYPVEFGRAILSLAGNAKDALMDNNTEAPFIRIDAFAENNNIAVVITDNGGGVPPEIAGRIFEPYFTTKDEGKGTGLGLYTSKNLIEKCMGGTLTYTNTADGAAFKITLPAGQEGQDCDPL